MKNPTQKHIEIFVKDPSQLSEDEREWIRQSLENSEELKLLAEWFKKFFNVKKSVQAIKPKPFAQPDEIVLRSKKTEYKPGNSFVLAAQTLSSSKKQEIKTVKTFISRKHKTLMRVLRNEIKGETEVHLLSEHVSDDDIVLLYTPDEDIYLVSDEGGVISVPDDKINRDKITNWRQCNVHLPAFKLIVTKQSTGKYRIDTDQKLHDSSILNIEKTDSHVNVTLAFRESWVDPNILVCKSQDSKSMWFLKRGEVQIPAEYFRGQKAVIYLYN